MELGASIGEQCCDVGVRPIVDMRWSRFWGGTWGCVFIATASPSVSLCGVFSGSGKGAGALWQPVVPTDHGGGEGR